ncbi:fructan 1-exohydrolase IIb [Tanacetum coccineum]|uniref:Fructan 1-exohydrolase IIb n=1 Tax=Tanacetum coccineum TaxID=301880 RepID=A0ABQ5DV01_9ASTR
MMSTWRVLGPITGHNYMVWWSLGETNYVPGMTSMGRMEGTRRLGGGSIGRSRGESMGRLRGEEGRIRSEEANDPVFTDLSRLQQSNKRINAHQAEEWWQEHEDRVLKKNSLARTRASSSAESFPRALWIDRSGKQLIQWPVEEIELLRENEVTLQNKNLKPGSVLEIEGITASQADVTISFKLEDLKEAEVLDTTSVDPQALCTERGASSKGAFGPFGLLAMASKDLEEQTAIFFRVFQNQNGRYSVLMCSDLSRSTVRSNIDTTSFGAFVDIDPQYNEISLRNLVRKCFSLITRSLRARAEGKTCITSRIYPKFVNNEDAHLYAFNNGTQSVKISQMSAWSMKNAEFVMDQTLKSSA